MDEKEFLKRYERLNERQKEAVDYIDGPLLVVAGPGSGKTEILSLRVANILRQTDTGPDSILVLTFTDSAAVNMRQRLFEMIGKEAFRVSIFTFHGFGVEVIEKYPEHFYNGADLLPTDELAQFEVIEEILSELPHSDPLSSKDENDQFVYKKDIKDALGVLKEAGLLPEEFKKILKINEKFLKKINEIFTDVLKDRVTKDVILKLEDEIEKIEQIEAEDLPIKHFPSIKKTLIESIKEALDEAKSSGKTKPMTDWKKDNLFKQEDGTFQLRDLTESEKLHSLAGIYQEYNKRLRKSGFYDFSDMILEVIKVVENSESIRADLQEKYQYLLVDEFQDTNNSQMRLLHLLGQAAVNEGSPNIMTVGDDDQAIYKFQGANLDNLLGFKDTYPETKVITLSTNYRSKQEILNLAEETIRAGEERLENKLEEVKKDLRAGQEGEGQTHLRAFEDEESEYRFIAQKTKELIEKGLPANEIAIIGKKHKFLLAASEYLIENNVPVDYERKDNIFKQSHIYQLLQMSKLTYHLSLNDLSGANYFWPEVLSFPFWELPRLLIWRISVESYKRHHDNWLELLLEDEDKRIRDIGEFFLQLANQAKFKTLEEMLDLLIGSQPVSLNDKEFISPFKNYYFEQKKPTDLKYLSTLSSLKTFIGAIREHKQGQLLKLSNLIEFVESHERNNIQILDKTAFKNSDSAVKLLTAHRAKGMEFQVVFVINCQDQAWIRDGKKTKLRFPINLNIAREKETTDDKLRLFYVAITRAKEELYLTRSKNSNGKEAVHLRFIPESHQEKELEVKERNDDRIEKPVLFQDPHQRPIESKEEQKIMQALVDQYQLSVTHLNNFLNLKSGGPNYFFEQNLLHFPKAKSPVLAFGSAIHKAIEMAHLHLKKEDKLPKLEKINESFKNALKKERLNEKEEKKQLQKGLDALKVYFQKKGKELSPSDLVEFNFKDQGVVLDKAHLSGKIDRIKFLNKEEMEVIDLKTGKPMDNWKDSQKKEQLYSYRRQLIFYKLLVENSSEFKEKFKVKRGALEFVVPKDQEIKELDAEISEEEVKQLHLLIEAVFAKIKNLDFPDVSGYEKNLNGIKEFEKDLIEGRI